MKKVKLSSYAYQCFIKQLLTLANIDKWNMEWEESITMEKYMKEFAHIYIVSNVAKYRSFQFRLLHRAILLNPILYKWNITQTDLCTFCGKHKETYSHLFVMCEKVQDIWIRTENFMNSFNEVQITFNVKNVSPID